MSVLHPNSKRRAEGDRGDIKIGREENTLNQNLLSSSSSSESESAAATAAAEDEAWATAEQTFADSIIAVTVREVKRRRGDHCAGVSPCKADMIRANVHSWVSAARKQRGCAGTEDNHQHAAHSLCPGEFLPQTFFSKGVVEFAHWKAHKRNNDPCQLIRNRCRVDDNDTFAKWLAQKGRFMSICCHALESTQDSRR